MQTFLPDKFYPYSARYLDNKRLGKQRVETLQILNTLSGRSKGWKYHPAVRMWKNFEQQLVIYGLVVCGEWISRGFKDTCKQKIIEYKYLYFDFKTINCCPPWLGDERFHSSHRAALLKKNFEWYSQFNWKEEPVINYYWPVRK